MDNIVVKRYDDYSLQELAKLTTEQVATLISLECLELGIQEVDFIESQTPQRTIKIDTSIYGVRLPDYNTIYFKDKNDATKFMNSLSEINDAFIRYSYTGSDRYIVGKHESAITLETIPVFSQELYEKAGATINVESKELSDYTKKKSDYTKDSARLQQVSQDVFSAYSNARRKMNTRSLLVSKYLESFDIVFELNDDKSDVQIHQYTLKKYVEKMRQSILEAFADNEMSIESYCIDLFVEAIVAEYLSDFSDDEIAQIIEQVQ